MQHTIYAIWRRTFDETMKDPEFLAVMREARLDVIGTMTGDELARLIAEINRTPPDVVAQIKDIIGPLRAK